MVDELIPAHIPVNARSAGAQLVENARLAARAAAISVGLDRETQDRLNCKEQWQQCGGRKPIFGRAAAVAVATRGSG